MLIEGVISLNMKAKRCSNVNRSPYKDLINSYRELLEAVKSY